MYHYSKRYIWYQIVTSFLVSIFCTFAIWVQFLPEELEILDITTFHLWMFLGIYVIVEVVWIIYAILSWYYTTYTFDEDAIVLKKGIFFKSKKSLRYEKIHAIDYKQNIIHKLFGIKKLSIDSGATIKAEIAEIVIIEEEEKIELIEQQIRNHMNQYITIDKEDESFYKYATGYKFLYVIFKILPLFFIAIISLIVTLIFYSINPYYQITKILLILTAFLFAGSFFLCFSYFIGVLIKYYDYQIYIKDKYLHIDFGLFTRSNNILPLEKIQAVIIAEGLIRRLFKIVEIKLELVGFGENVNNITTNYFIPLCCKKDVNQYLDKLNLGFKLETEVEKSPSRAFKYFYSLKLIIVSIIAMSLFPIAAIFKTLGIIIFFSLYVVCIIIILFISILEYINSGIYLDSKKVIIHHGSINKKLTIILNRNIIEIEKKDTYCRKRKQLASFAVHFFNSAIKNVATVKLINEDVFNRLENNIIY